MRLKTPKLVVVDRDGTLIKYIPYLFDPLLVEVLPTVAFGLQKLKAAGCLLFLHTNQSGIGRGYFSEEAATSCNDEMLNQLNLGPDLFDEICMCPEAPNGVAEYRKPSPRFGRELINKYKCERNDIFYIGDNLSDLLTAKNIGCRGVGVNTGVHDLRQELARENLASSFTVHDSFMAAVDYLLPLIEFNA